MGTSCGQASMVCTPGSGCWAEDVVDGVDGNIPTWNEGSAPKVGQCWEIS